MNKTCLRRIKSSNDTRAKPNFNGTCVRFFFVYVSKLNVAVGYKNFCMAGWEGGFFFSAHFWTKNL